MECCQSLAAKRFLLWYIVIVSLIIFPLSWDVVSGCTMMVVGPVGAPKSSMKGFGFYSTAIYDSDTGSFLGCVDYSQNLRGDVDDVVFKLSRVFGGLLGAFITLATVLCLLVQCFNKHGKSCLWNIMRWSYGAAFLCQGATFAIMGARVCRTFGGEKSQCFVGRDGSIAIVNAILLFVMVIATTGSLPPRNPVFRCWHTVDEVSESETDDEVDPENPQPPVKPSLPKRTSMEDSESVCLFSTTSSRSLRSNARLTVKERAQRLEKKSIWPMNTFAARALTPVNNESNTAKAGGTKDQKKWQPTEDPRVRTYYRNQRNIFKRFENERTTDTVTAASSSTQDESTLESKKNGSAKSNPSEDSIPNPVDRNNATMPSPFDKPIQPPPRSQIMSSRGPSPFNKPVNASKQYETPKGGRDTPPGATYPRQSKEQQMALDDGNEEGEEKQTSIESGSIKSDSVKSDSNQSGSIKSKGSAKSINDLFPSLRKGINKNTKSEDTKKGSSNVDGSSASEGSEKSGKSKNSKESNASAPKSVSSADHPMLDRLRKSIVLEKDGTRIEETRIGDTMKIVDEYPAKGKSSCDSQAKRGDSSERSGVVKVRTEYCPDGRKTVMEERFLDGSRTVTTLIDPTTMDD